MGLTNIEITIEDRDWPNIKMIIKEGTQVQVTTALCDIAATKFQPIVSNYINRAIGALTDRRKRNV